jgi:beta-carotene hydroxylase
MTTVATHLETPSLPTIDQLGRDLLYVRPWRCAASLVQPFVCIAVYATFAALGLWPLAVVTLMYLSFITYGSISHDLVHRTLGLPPWLNDVLLSVIELLAFRSGHAYRLAHLHHHARFPHDDDIEGAAAKMSLPRAIVEGFVYWPRIVTWSLRRSHRLRGLVLAETLAGILLLAACLLCVRVTIIPAVYAALMVMGTWIFPLVTSYIPHNAAGRSRLFQTRLFRGRVISLIAMDHLYHLEHHLYPAVPHHNWVRLARRLDPYLSASGVQPIVLGF